MRENDDIAGSEIHSPGIRSRSRLAVVNEPIAGLALGDRRPYGERWLEAASKAFRPKRMFRRIKPTSWRIILSRNW